MKGNLCPAASLGPYATAFPAHMVVTLLTTASCNRQILYVYLKHEL